MIHLFIRKPYYRIPTLVKIKGASFIILNLGFVQIIIDLHHQPTGNATEVDDTANNRMLTPKSKPT